MPTVLVVDDEPHVCQLVASVLERAGFSVLTAGSGSEAISISQTHVGRLDLLLSDVVMPGMDGATLARELRADAPGLPVILMSGACDDSVLHASPPVRFLSKPFSLAKLVRLVRTVACR